MSGQSTDKVLPCSGDEGERLSEGFGGSGLGCKTGRLSAEQRDRDVMGTIKTDRIDAVTDRGELAAVVERGERVQDVVCQVERGLEDRFGVHGDHVMRGLSIRE